MLMNKVEFCLKVVLLVKPGTYWVMCYVKLFNEKKKPNKKQFKTETTKEKLYRQENSTALLKYIHFGILE